MILGRDLPEICPEQCESAPFEQSVHHIFVHKRPQRVHLMTLQLITQAVLHQNSWFLA